MNMADSCGRYRIVVGISYNYTISEYHYLALQSKRRYQI